jgi:hypothetical protein
MQGAGVVGLIVMKIWVSVELLMRPACRDNLGFDISEWCPEHFRWFHHQTVNAIHAVI